MISSLRSQRCFSSTSTPLPCHRMRQRLRCAVCLSARSSSLQRREMQRYAPLHRRINSSSTNRQSRGAAERGEVRWVFSFAFFFCRLSAVSTLVPTTGTQKRKTKRGSRGQKGQRGRRKAKKKRAMWSPCCAGSGLPLCISSRRLVAACDRRALLPQRIVIPPPSRGSES